MGDIMHKQIELLEKIPNAKIGAKIECDFTPVIAYLEWCGIKLDEDKWKAKMLLDKQALADTTKALNDYCLKHPKLTKWVYQNTQGDLFDGYDLTPKFKIDWQKKEAIEVFKALGFNTQTISKTTGNLTDSITEKLITSQKGIDDEFLRLFYGKGEPDDDDYYIGYNGAYKVVTSFGQGHLNAINPNTGRLHTVYRAIGTVSGRMSSGSDQPNEDLAKLKGIPPSTCKYPNMQQLPKNAITRACFVAEKGNLFCSCDYSAMEARIGADVYNETKLLEEFLHGSGDTHAAYAKAVFAEELDGIDTKDIKKKRPDLRQKVKSIEFAVQFGSDGTAVAPQLKIPVEEARALVQNLLNGMTGLKAFKQKWSKFVLDNGYMPIMPQTGHRAYWHDWEHWKEVEASHTREFWDNYKLYHKGTGDSVAETVKKHFQAKSKWCDRMSLNLPTQGGGAVVLKEACINLYKWIIDNNLWGKVLLVNLTHDECNTEFPEELAGTYPQVVAKIMKDAAAKYYHKLPIPANPEVGDHWIH
jgi:DNA polymerase I-like protein with 3'-5' exonuclease and polymerase domains